MRAYFVWLTREARARFDAGMTANEAVLDIALDEFRDWSDPERIVVNLDTLYREFGAPQSEPDTLRLLQGMSEYARA